MHKTRFALIVIGCLCLLLLMQTVSLAQYDRFIFRPPQPQESFFQKYIGKYFRETLFEGSYAIIIAVGDYTHLPRLESVQADAEKMTTFLLNTAEYDEVVVLTDGVATFETIRYFMTDYFPKQMTSGRYRFLFYFSGHGTQREGIYGPIGYLQLQQATRDPGTASINMNQIENWAEEFRNATHVLFLLDACFSGLAGTEDKSYTTAVDPVELAQENGRYMITAGGADQTSIASLKRWKGSLFTDVVIHGMSGEADSSPQDGIVTTYELFTYTQAAVRNEARKARHEQTPLISNLGRYTDKGQYFFVYTDPIPPPVETVAVPDDKEKKQIPVLRNTPQIISSDDVKQEFGLVVNSDRYNYGIWVPRTYITNQYEDRDEVVFDHVTGLMWQKSGSKKYLTYAEAQTYIKKLNQERFAGYDDWRLPTIPELKSLLEPEESSNGLYIDSIFDKTQRWCWSADRQSVSGSSSAAWYVSFYSGGVYWRAPDDTRYVRAVRL